MPGTIEGGKLAAQTNKERHGDNFYQMIGALGGKSGAHTGFGSDTVGKDGLTGRQRAIIAGSKGGQVSKRPKNQDVQTEEQKQEAKVKKEKTHGWFHFGD